YPVFPFLAIRFTIAFLALLPLVRNRRFAWGLTAWGPVRRRRLDLAAGVLVGLFLFTAYATQTFGLLLSTPTKTAFITGLSIVMVPLGAALFLHRPPSRWALAGVAVATVGLALLTLNEQLRIGAGDLLVLMTAFSLAGHIIAVGRFAPDGDPLLLTLAQLATVAVASGVGALLTGGWHAGLLSLPVLAAIVFTGVFATAFAFAAQTSAQRFTTPTHTAVIFAGEPVFAAIFSYLFAGEMLGGRALLGCALILAGVLAAELGDLAWAGLRRRPASRLSVAATDLESPGGETEAQGLLPGNELLLRQ
ncbi:MAG: DMT family transporter, partial [Anaerolineae bacterium]|nr:DMT family transporter [Anaerolineae bacterium]